MPRHSNRVDRQSVVRAAGAFLLSALGHGTALLALGLTYVSVGAIADWRESLVARIDATNEDRSPIDEPAADDAMAYAVAVTGPASTIRVSAVAAATALTPLDVQLDVASFSTAPLAFGIGGDGMGDMGQAIGRGKTNDYAAARFFGIPAEGKSFVYVVDCSGSMRDNGRFARAREELLRSIEHLESDHRYYIIFYNDLTYPMDETDLVEATPEQLAETREWVKLCRPGGFTVPLPALVQALSLRPDAIFFLSDGKFATNTLRAVRERNEQGSARIPIHAIAFSSREGEELMRAIAKASGGTFRFAK